MEQTYIMVKPDGVQRGLVGEVGPFFLTFSLSLVLSLFLSLQLQQIIGRFERRGYQLVGLKMVSPTREHLEEHYRDLSELPFFPGLIDYMLSGPVVGMVWAGNNVIAMGRKMLGATKPQESEPGTIRGDFAVEVGRNVCHGSANSEDAEREIALWFPEGLNAWEDHSAAWVYEGK